MDTVVYLTSEQNIDQFNWLEEKYLLNKQLKENLVEETFLNCVKTDLRSISTAYLIIDVMIMKDKEPKSVLLGLETFCILNPDSQVILYVQEKWDVQDSIDILQKFYIIDSLSPVKSQFDALTGHNTENEEGNEIIDGELNEADEDAKDGELEIQKLVEDNRKSENGDQTIDIYEKTNQKIKAHEGIPLAKQCMEQVKTQEEQVTKRIVKVGTGIWNCSNIVIIVAGTDRRTGTTTAAIQLCNCLSKNGARVCYSEAVLETHLHLEAISKEFDFKEEEDCYFKEDICFYPGSVFDTNAGLNFIVLDIGAIQERPKWAVSIIQNIANEVILVSSGTREYELQCLDNSMVQLEEVKEKIRIILNFISDEKYEKVKENYRVPVHRGEYEPALFMSTAADEEIVTSLQQYNN